MSTRWSLGVLIGLPILILVILGLAILAFSTLRYAKGQKGDAYGDYGIAMAFGCAAAGIAGLLTIAALLPVPVGYWNLNSEWHQWRPVSGTIQTISSRFLAGDNGGSNERFVVQFQGNPKQFACDDTRCALLKSGDVLHLSCKRHWQYSGVSGY